MPLIHNVDCAVDRRQTAAVKEAPISKELTRRLQEETIAQYVLFATLPEVQLPYSGGGAYDRSIALKLSPFPCDVLSVLHAIGKSICRRLKAAWI